MRGWFTRRAPGLTDILDTSELPRICVGAEQGRRCTVNGKQVLLDGNHLADAFGEASAAMIADCIQYSGLPAHMWPEDALRRVQSYLA